MVSKIHKSQKSQKLARDRAKIFAPWFFSNFFPYKIIWQNLKKRKSCLSDPPYPSGVSLYLNDPMRKLCLEMRVGWTYIVNLIVYIGYTGKYSSSCYASSIDQRFSNRQLYIVYSSCKGHRLRLFIRPNRKKLIVYRNMVLKIRAGRLVGRL